MARLSIYLPPFAGDYSGVCSALFDFHCLIVLCDAACCTKNYIDYDEPRWSRAKTTTLCAQLRTIEAVLGDDRRILDQTVEAAATARPDFVALLGSPVPAIIGMDMAGMAREVEQRTGIPAFGFNTTGFSPYQRGVAAAQLALFRRFAAPMAETIPRSVNILGLTPLDVGSVGNEQTLRAAVEGAGCSVLCSYLMGGDLTSVARSSAASVNLVVTASGLPLAREMESACGIPYIPMMPMGSGGRADLARLLESAPTGVSRPPDPCPPGPDGILVVGDQVIAHSLRLALLARGCRRPVSVGSFLGLDPALALPGDLELAEERDLIRALRSGRFTTLIGDPLFQRIPDSRDLELISLPHPALSGQFGWGKVPRFPDQEMDALLDQMRLEQKGA